MEKPLEALKFDLKDAHKKVSEMKDYIHELEELIKDKSDIQPGDKVIVVAKPVKHKSVGSQNGPSLGKKQSEWRLLSCTSTSTMKEN